LANIENENLILKIYDDSFRWILFMAGGPEAGTYSKEFRKIIE